MIEREPLTFCCDTCPDTFEPDVQDSFPDAWTEARALGWLTFKDAAGNQVHLCPNCQEAH